MFLRSNLPADTDADAQSLESGKLGVSGDHSGTAQGEVLRSTGGAAFVCHFDFVKLRLVSVTLMPAFEDIGWDDVRGRGGLIINRDTRTVVRLDQTHCGFNAQLPTRGCFAQARDPRQF